ncbi:bifunctional 4-hydroxy-2-oxoglutarate aldolase/2-dehydro-3-deoxy-phosphogluconate aldolase [Psychromicrobium xiongbiense]|uniref:bifunctional 4-hydroxy-2-oxoglutarate aldolase/2-dehydro-3-deoxy-phosphogluconate aldolase n=1 Tax=Psychromicrobium xiongbiense TaxID=3051184 RepID=UPI0025573893|nr:bifunctional 4-hydroxy-2-oxoglutarate aldolase/2-dehydro-3-deoxy-phosphogluconate aldolase [Psychromicrobium sp. YIM S02556]
MSSDSTDRFLAQLASDRTLAVVRAEAIPDVAALCRALVAGGIHCVEFTFTTPGVLELIRTAAENVASHGAIVGVGTVMTATQAKAAIDAGAQFLVTPGLRPAVAQEAVAAGVPITLGAMTPSEVAVAMDLGSSAVKIFPARNLGPAYLRDLHGPYPEVQLLPSGGIDASNAASYLQAGALAVACGTSVVSPATVAAGDWGTITARATEFTSSLS